MMTIKLSTAVTEGKGRIVAIDLPTELAAGADITGSVDMINDGDADTMALVLITEWNEKAYGWVGNMNAGETVTVNIPADLITMPNQDAVIDIYACHAEPGGELNIGGTEFKIDDTKTH